MTSRDFVFWLQGYFEISELTELNEKQIKVIKRHLDLVFAHDIDPSLGDKEHQEKLQDIHDGDTTGSRNITNKFKEIRIRNGMKLKC